MKLKELCKSKGITIKKLSEITGISLIYLYELNRGTKKNPSADIALKLAKALNIDIEELIQAS
ncbi:MAG: helix-turn-helix transcriptional regulator [Caloramator sp.]|nr:helix-turn-helix transcriptional regulator [Caloramator sp.]